MDSFVFETHIFGLLLVKENYGHFSIILVRTKNEHFSQITENCVQIKCHPTILG